jgi:two-component system OmpR family response regulator
MRVLVVDAHKPDADYLARALTEDGHVVDAVHDGHLGLAMAREGIHELLIVDRDTPGMDGVTLVRKLRPLQPALAIIMLGAGVDAAGRAEGLAAGCDDYLLKPVATTELLARVDAVGRRPAGAVASARLALADLALDLVARKVWRDGTPIAIAPREFLLLEYLVRHAGQVVTRTALIEAVWAYDFEPQASVVDTHVYRLRRKIDAGRAPLIHTLPGVGYMLSDIPPERRGSR